MVMLNQRVCQITIITIFNGKITMFNGKIWENPLKISIFHRKLAIEIPNVHGDAVSPCLRRGDAMQRVPQVFEAMRQIGGQQLPRLGIQR